MGHRSTNGERPWPDSEFPGWPSDTETRGTRTSSDGASAAWSPVAGPSWSSWDSRPAATRCCLPPPHRKPRPPVALPTPGRAVPAARSPSLFICRWPGRSQPPLCGLSSREGWARNRSDASVPPGSCSPSATPRSLPRTPSRHPVPLRKERHEHGAEAHRGHHVRAIERSHPTCDRQHDEDREEADVEAG